MTRCASEGHPGPANLFILGPPNGGPVRALRLHHPTKTWVFDPSTVWARLTDDFDQGDELISRVDRLRAEEIARELTTLPPSDAELRVVLEEGASEEP